MPVMTASSFAPNAENTRQLRDAFGRFATGVTVVTCDSADGPVGITANSFSSLSLEPALVMWAPARASRRFPYFQAADHFAIHVLAANQAALSQSFAKNPHGFSETPGRNANGVPLIEGALARFECRRTAMHDGGDHMIVVGAVEQVTMQDGDALAFFAGKIGAFEQE